jgi:hypothetical protein
MWGPPPTDVYLPANSIALFSYAIMERTAHMFGCCARLKAGVTIEQAQAELGGFTMG